MIAIKRLTKNYGAAQALVDIDLEVARGESVGLVGPNGSGRTTLLRVVATLVPPSNGSVQIDGLDTVRDVYRLRPRIAYVGTEGIEPERMRVGEYVRMALGTRRRPATQEIVDEAVARAGLDGQMRCAALSGGMRQRLALAAALAAQPAVLLLDDPFRGLDPSGRSRFVEWLLEARDRGSVTLLTTQSDEELAAACTRVARFDRGRLTGVSIVSKSAAPARPAAVRR